jgi:cytochrome P450
MLQHFINAKDQNGQPVQKSDVMIEGVNILGAGADTTSIAILAVLGALLLHPEQKKELMLEVDQAYNDLGLAGKSEEISYKDCEKLPLLSAVVKESMRLHPSITYQLPRVVPHEGVQIGPYHFDRKIICGISTASMNRLKEIFGNDAGEWKPERWIAKSPEDERRISSMNQDMTTVSPSHARADGWC